MREQGSKISKNLPVRVQPGLQEEQAPAAMTGMARLVERLQAVTHAQLTVHNGHLVQPPRAPLNDRE